MGRKRWRGVTGRWGEVPGLPVHRHATPEGDYLEVVHGSECQWKTDTFINRASRSPYGDSFRVREGENGAKVHPRRKGKPLHPD